MKNSKTAEISEEKLNELEKQTNDKFTRLLINNLKRRLLSLNETGLYEEIDFDRILNLIKKEKKNKKLKEFKKENWDNLNFNLKIHKISWGNKTKNIEVGGHILLNTLSLLIQKEFDLEPGHLYEFQIDKFKFGPKCDEWLEIFDSLDNFKLGLAISAAKLKKGDDFKFIYDFGDNIKFKIEILNVS